MAIRFWGILILMVISSWGAMYSIPIPNSQKDTEVSIELYRNQKVMYIGIDNPFHLNLCGTSHDDVTVSIDNGATIQYKDGYYRALVKNEGIVTITVKHKKKQQKQIGEFKVKVVSMPNPVVKIGNDRPGSIPAAKFKVLRGIVAQLEGFSIDLPIKIESFEFVHVSAGQPSSVYKIEGPAFPPNVQALMQSAKAGDYIIIDNVKIDMLGGRTLPAAVFSLI